MTRRYDISREEVGEAWKAVRYADGCAGLDGKSIEKVEADLDNELYKVWNRMSSGSYQAQAVKIVSIPKVKGGYRNLGIPTVTDRVAQTVIKNRLEKEVDHLFHKDSYAYRAGKSAIDGVMKARERCMSRQDGWVVEVDIKGYFDNLDHEKMLEILSKYTKDESVLLYSKKFLKAERVKEEDQEKAEIDKGTPQGGVLSPLLANLYLHEAFDLWMSETHENLPFERYADDIIVHCMSEKQAYYIKDRIEERLKVYNLEMNLEKSKVVYAGKYDKHDRRGHEVPRKFTFLGYDFKPRRYKGKIVFTPAMGRGALTAIREKIKKMKLYAMVQKPIEEVAAKLNKTLRGWINYYGHCRRSELYKLADSVNCRIVKYLKKKHKKRLHGKSWRLLKELKRERPKLFVHWYMIAPSPQRAV